MISNASNKICTAGRILTCVQYNYTPSILSSLPWTWSSHNLVLAYLLAVCSWIICKHKIIDGYESQNRTPVVWHKPTCQQEIIYLSQLAVQIHHKGNLKYVRDSTNSMKQELNCRADERLSQAANKHSDESVFITLLVTNPNHYEAWLITRWSDAFSSMPKKIRLLSNIQFSMENHLHQKMLKTLVLLKLTPKNLLRCWK